MQHENDLEGFAEINLKELLDVLNKRKWLIVALVVLAVITSGILSFFVLPPVYEADTTLMVVHSAEQQRYLARDDGTMEDVVRTLARLPEMTINTYMAQLKNDALLETVIERLGMAADGYTTKGLAGMITVNLMRDTNLVKVKVTNTDPARAALIANTLSEEFLNFITAKNRERMGQSIEMLQEQIVLIEEDLTAARALQEEFNKDPRGINFIEQELISRLADLTTHQSMLIQSEIELSQILAARNQLEIRLATIEPLIFREEQVERRVAMDTTEDAGGEGNPGSENTEGENTGETADQVESGETVWETILETVLVEEPNPDYVVISFQFDEKIQEMVVKQAKISSITAVIASLEQEAKDLQSELTGRQSAYSLISRNLEKLERNYDLFTERLVQTQVFQSIDIGETNILVVAPAVQPTAPFKPNKRLNVAIAFVLALMLGVFIAFVLEFLDDSIKSVEDIKRYLDLPVVGSIPHMDM